MSFIYSINPSIHQLLNITSIIKTVIYPELKKSNFSYFLEDKEKEEEEGNLVYFKMDGETRAPRGNPERGFGENILKLGTLAG